jgi:hypothetical protein
MTIRILIAAVAACAALAGCTKATPDKVLRVEGSAPVAPSLCARMAEDFDMVLAEGSALRGQTWRVSHADRLISARGVSWGFRLIDDLPEESCVNAANGVTCEVVGPAEFRVQSNAGRATYLVASNDRATVASEGAIMTCVEPPTGS